MTSINNTDALSILANKVNTAPKLRFTHLFDAGVPLVADSALAKGTNNFYTNIYTGNDSLGHSTTDFKSCVDTTGFYEREEVIIDPLDVVAANYTDIATVFNRSSAINDFPGGKGNKIIYTQIKRNDVIWGNRSYPQVWGTIGYRTDITKQLPTLRYSFQIKVPSNLTDILTGRVGSDEWWEIFAIKANWDNSKTDSRLTLMLRRDVNTRALYFQLQLTLFGYNSGTGTYSNYSAAWNLNSAPGTLIPGDIYKVDLYFKPPATNVDMSGVAQILIINQSKNTIAMKDEKTNAQMMGDGEFGQGINMFNFGRIMWAGLYTGGFPATGNITVEYGNIMIWQGLELF